MALKSKPFYWVECDGCEARCPHEDAEVAAWSDSATAVEDAENWDWQHYRRPGDDMHLCPECTPRDADGDPWEELP